MNQKYMYFLLLFVPFFWGGAFGAAKHVITEIPPFTAATMRFGVAGIILLIVLLIKSEWNYSLLVKQWRGLCLMAITGIFGYNAFFFIALNYTSAINGSLIMATTPVFITIGAVILFNESWNASIGFGLLLSLFGVLLVILKGSLNVLLSLSFNTGDLLFILGLICWVAHGLLGKKVMRTVSPLFATTISTLIGSIGLGLASLFENGWKYVPDMSGQAWFEMWFMIIGASVIAFLLWNIGIQQIGASKSSLYMNLVPVNATWIALVFYNAEIAWQQIIGVVLVILGVYIVTSKGNSTIKKPLVQSETH